MKSKRLLTSCLLGVGLIISGCSGGGNQNANVPNEKPSPAKGTTEPPVPKESKPPTDNKTPAHNKTENEDQAAKTEPSPETGDAKTRKIRLGAPTEPLETITAPSMPDYASVDTIPAIKLSTSHKATCLVNVGDVLPDATLTDLEGKSVMLSKLRGEKMTLVLFWSADREFAVEAFNDLASNLVKPYFEHGLQVVSINVGDLSEGVKSLAGTNAGFFPILLDPKGEYFALVAKSKLPRLYLLDGAGKIIWFEMEYSRTSRRELHQTIRLKLGLNPPPKKNV